MVPGPEAGKRMSPTGRYSIVIAGLDPAIQTGTAA